MTYTEDALVEQPAIKLFNELGWDTLNYWDEDFGEESLLGRENRGDVVLINRLRPKLNPDFPELAIELKGTEGCAVRQGQVLHTTFVVH